MCTNDVFTDVNGVSIPYSAVFAGINRSIEVFAATKGHSLTVTDKDDIFQNAACKATMYSNKYDSKKSSPATWSGSIAWNCACDFLAKKLGTDTISINDLEWNDEEGGIRHNAEVEMYRSNDYAADKPVEMRETKRRLEEAKNGLNERSRKILEMTEDGLKPRQIAEILGCTPGAVSVILCRARRHIEHRLNQE